MCWSLFINKVTSVLQLSLKRNFGTCVSLCKFCETFKSNLFTEHLWTTDLKISLYACIYIWKQYLENFAFLILRIRELYTRLKMVHFLRNRLFFSIFYCFWNPTSTLPSWGGGNAGHLPSRLTEVVAMSWGPISPWRSRWDYANCTKPFTLWTISPAKFKRWTYDIKRVTRKASYDR